MAISSGKSSARKTVRQLSFAAAIFAATGLVVAQSAPEIETALKPLRFSAADILSSRGKATWWDSLTRASEKDRRIAELERQVQELSRYKLAAYTMTARMETYERILKLMGEPLHKGLTARVVSEIDGPFSLTRLANAGAEQGVPEDAIALNEGGLVGRVIQRGRSSARILLVTDYNSRVPVLGEVSGARGVMFGDRDGQGTLTDMPERGGFRVGERILTSGEGGLFPNGLLVGRAYQQDENWRVALGMHEGNADYVRLVPPARIPKPEDDPVPAPEAEIPLASATGDGEGVR